MKNLNLKLMKTDDSWAPLFLRLGFAIMMFPHGAQKVFGWFGGFGFEGTMGFFTGQLGIPWIFAFSAIVVEFAASVTLAVGLQTRLSAALLGVVMLVAATFHFEHGFFMNWFGNQKGEGWEFHLLAVAMMASVVVLGGGRGSIDRQLHTGSEK